MTSANRRPKPHRKLPPEVLCPDEVGALIAALHGDCYTQIRNRALIAVLYRSGLRNPCTELLHRHHARLLLRQLARICDVYTKPLPDRGSLLHH